MTRTGQAAIDYAHGRVGGTMPASGYCLQFVRQCFDVGSYYASAIDAWNGARVQHPGDRNPPPAVPLFFLSPSVYDHVVFGGGPPAGDIVTTFNADIRHYGGDAIAGIERDFDATYLGWTEDINGVTVYTPGGGGPTPPPIGSEDDDMLQVFNGSRGEAILAGSRLVPLGDQSSVESIKAAGVPRVAITEADWDRLATNGNVTTMITEPSRGFAILSGAQAIGIGDMGTVYALRGIGVPTINVGAADFDRFTGAITNAIPDEVVGTSARSVQGLVALILAVALVFGIIAVLVTEVVTEGVWAGSGALLGGIVGLLAYTLGARRRGGSTSD